MDEGVWHVTSVRNTIETEKNMQPAKLHKLFSIRPQQEVRCVRNSAYSAWPVFAHVCPINTVDMDITLLRRRRNRRHVAIAVSFLFISVFNTFPNNTKLQHQTCPPISIQVVYSFMRLKKKAALSVRTTIRTRTNSIFQ